MLSGGSGMNAMMFVCGTKSDYDTWATVSSNDWNYATMLTYIKRLMTQTDTDLTTGPYSSFYGTTGPLVISKFGSDDNVIPIIRAASTEIGYSELPDINCGLYNGLAKLRGTLRFGERRTAAIARLAPHLRSNNVWVMKNTVVNKLITTRNTLGQLVITGVNVATQEINCTNFNLVATREVILSAGAFNSPRILLRSGIGRAADLTPHGITQNLNLNVGNNYQDHSVVHFFVTLPTTPAENALAIWLNWIDFLAKEVDNYLTIPRTGFFTNLGPVEWSAFYNLATNSSTANPDFQMIFYRYDRDQFEFELILKEKYRFKPEIADHILQLNKNNTILYMQVIRLNPLSRGTVKLRDTNPYSDPLIDANFFSDVGDVDRTVVLNAINKVLSLVQSSPMQNARAQIVQFPMADCNQTFGTTDYWKECYIPKFSSNLWHPTSTCTMGKTTDPNAVVDPKLRVIGINTRPYLRVADAAIMPYITSGNTMCPAYAIGERAFEFIKADNP
jgi:choline dehydrogenase